MLLLQQHPSLPGTPLSNTLNSSVQRQDLKFQKVQGAQVDVAAARLIKEKGKEVLPSFVKLHFANTEKAMKKLK